MNLFLLLNDIKVWFD